MYEELLFLWVALDMDCRDGLHRSKRVEIGLQSAYGRLKAADSGGSLLDPSVDGRESVGISGELAGMAHQFRVQLGQRGIEGVEGRVDGGDVRLALVQVLHLLRTHCPGTFGGGLADTEGVGLRLDGTCGDVDLAEGEINAVAVVGADGDVGDEGVELGEKRAPSGERSHVRLEGGGAEEVDNLLEEGAEDFDGDCFLASLLLEGGDELGESACIYCHIFAFYCKDMGLWG